MPNSTIPEINTMLYLTDNGETVNTVEASVFRHLCQAQVTINLQPQQAKKATPLPDGKYPTLSGEVYAI